MRAFLASFVGSLAGKIVAAAVLALCIAIGFGPDKWVAWLMTADVAAYGLLFMRGLFLVLGLAILALLTSHMWGLRGARSQDQAEGERVAALLEGMRNLGRTQIDAQAILNIWYADQPTNRFLRIANKQARMAILREAVRRGWIRTAEQLPDDPHANYLCEINDVIVFFRDVRWHEIS